jgi:phage terminase small subunit
VQDRVAELQAARVQLLKVTQDQVVREFAKLAFVNMQDFITVQADGSAYTDLRKLTRDQAAAIQEITVDRGYTEGRGDAARNVKRVKVKLADKQGALNSFAKHLGMYTDRMRVEVTDSIAQAMARAAKRVRDANLS